MLTQMLKAIWIEQFKHHQHHIAIQNELSYGTKVDLGKDLFSNGLKITDLPISKIPSCNSILGWKLFCNKAYQNLYFMVI